MQRWKKGLFIGLFSSMLWEQQAVAGAVGLAEPAAKQSQPSAPPVVAAAPAAPAPAEMHPLENVSKRQAAAIRRFVPKSSPEQADLTGTLATRPAMEAAKRELAEAEEARRVIEAKRQALALSSRGDLPRRGANTAQEASAQRTAAKSVQPASNSAPTLMAGSGATSTLGARVAALALKYQGVPYVYGGTTPSGFDCSGFIQYVMKEAGVDVPRTTYSQATAGVRVSRANLMPGDIVIFSCGGQATSHSGIYLGNDKFIHADQSRGIYIDDLNRAYWAGVYQAGVRVQ